VGKSLLRIVATEVRADVLRVAKVEPRNCRARQRPTQRDIGTQREGLVRRRESPRLVEGLTSVPRVLSRVKCYRRVSMVSDIILRRVLVRALCCRDLRRRTM